MRSIMSNTFKIGVNTGDWTPAKSFEVDLKRVYTIDKRGSYTAKVSSLKHTSTIISMRWVVHTAVRWNGFAENPPGNSGWMENPILKGCSYSALTA